MKIATWNVNSVRQRTEHLLRYLRDVQSPHEVLSFWERQAVTITATVASTVNSSLAGTVNFYDAGNLLGSSAASASG